jgi:NADPH:quinone reductase-like Zn-dependent oxidoreductase
MQNWQEGVLTPAKAKGALGGDIDGMLAEQVVLAETGLVRVPEHLSYVEAATLPCAAVTAWNALGAGNLQPGAAVLIQGTGGVSLFALQFAKWLGMRVFGISSSDEKLQRARTMGLDSGVNYRLHPDWDRWALDETGGEGVDLVVEVGGAGTINRSLRALRMGGTIAQIGVLTSAQTAEPLAVPLLLHKTAHIHGIYVGSRLDFEGMNAAITNAQIRPVVSAADWSQAREALMQMEAGGHYGKAALTIE